MSSVIGDRFQSSSSLNFTTDKRQRRVDRCKDIHSEREGDLRKPWSGIDGESKLARGQCRETRTAVSCVTSVLDDELKLVGY
jgi:hypothetical protein